MNRSQRRIRAIPLMVGSFAVASLSMMFGAVVTTQLQALTGEKSKPSQKNAKKAANAAGAQDKVV